MAIATANANTPTTGAHGAHAAQARGKATDKAAAGFSALLDGMGLAAEDAQVPQGLEEPAKPQRAKDSTDTAEGQQPGALAQTAPAQPPAQTPQAQQEDAAAACDVQRVSVERGEKPSALRPAAPADAREAVAQAATETAPIEAAPDSIAELVARLRTGQGTSVQPEARAEESADGVHRATVDLAGAARDRAQRATQAALARATTADAARSAVLAQAQQAASASIAEARELRRGASGGNAEPSLSALSQVLASLEEGGLAVADRGRESHGSGASSAWAGTSSGLGAQGMATRAGEAQGVGHFASVVAEQQAAPQELLASQVSVWVSNKVQSAELRLDGFGEKPVQVEIALEGTQAHVRFSSDQPQIREILQSAAGELRQLLKDEGLQLAGLSVGSSADGSAGSAGRDASGGGGPGAGSGRSGGSGTPQEAAATAASASTAGPRPARPQGMVDLFA